MSSIVTGLLPDPPDDRDLLLRRYVKPGKLPDKVDHRKCLIEPVRDQKSEGVCAAVTAAGMKEFQEFRDAGLEEHLSPRYVYSEAKKKDGFPGVEGTTLRAVMSVLLSHGICLEATWPYTPHDKSKKPKDADDEASGFRIQSYAKLTTVLDMEKCLVGNGPFCLGLDISSVWDDVVLGIIADPPRRHQSLGGHAVCCCGYDRLSEHFLIRNSWSRFWGNEGYAWISYKHVMKCLISAWSSIDMPGSILPNNGDGG